MIELQPVLVPPSEWDVMERRIRSAFRRVVYEPLILEFELPVSILRNARGALFEAIASGRVTFYRGAFRGKFDAEITKELRELGAIWKNGQFKITLDRLPHDIHGAIKASEDNFNRKIARIDRRLAQIQPEEITDKLQLAPMLDKTIWRTEKGLEATLKGISVLPELSDEHRQRIADEWQNNLELDIKTFTAEEVLKLREAMRANVFAGNRYEAMIQTIKRSYGVTSSKAKFLARQETNLLVTKMKELRYMEAGVPEYRWRCVVGSKAHPVRPAHKALDGQVFRWDEPPITSEPGQAVRRNNAGADYNCRCMAIPLANFRKR